MNVKEKKILTKKVVHNEVKLRLTKTTTISKMVYVIDHM